MDIERYQRHFSIFGLSGQKALNNASVLIIGCGGIGCPVSLYLCASGIGEIGLVDNDTIELSNLQRQINYDQNDIGKSKALVTKAKLQAMNSNISVQAYNVRLDRKAAEELFPQYDLIIDGTDNFATRYLVNDISSLMNRPFISASILKDKAQLSFFNIQDGCYRCIYPSPPSQELVPNCAEAGVLGSVVGIVGTMAATLAINFFTDPESINHNIFKLIDSKTLDIQNIRYKKNNNCNSCVHKKVEEVSPQKIALEPHRLIAQNEAFDNGFYILDVRESWERDLGHIEDDHQHIPKSKIPYINNNDMPKDQKILCYCKSGFRSSICAKILIEKGYDAYSLAGGFDHFLDLER